MKRIKRETEQERLRSSQAKVTKHKRVEFQSIVSISTFTYKILTTVLL